MSDYLIYTIYCNSEQASKEWILSEDAPAPTTCPTDTAHVVTPESVGIKSTIREQRVEILDKDGKSAYSPVSEAGTPIQIANNVPPGYLLKIAGKFDDKATGKIGKGSSICQRGSGEVAGYFIHHWYVLGGLIASKNAECEDHVSMEVKAKAAIAASTPGAGNCNKIAIGPGLHMFVPAADDGDWTIDFDEMEVGEINKNASPVPSPGGSWTWNPDLTPSIKPLTDPETESPYFLFDFDKMLAVQADAIPLLFQGHITQDQLKGKKILPHWEVKFVFHEEAAGSLQAAACILMARKETTN